MRNVGPHTRREIGDDAYIIFMESLAMGEGAHAPDWTRTIGKVSHPAGNHCSGESGPINLHATYVLKLKILAWDGSGI